MVNRAILVVVKLDLSKKRTANMQITTKANASELAEVFIEFWLEKLNSSEGDFHVALSGGSTPRLIFEIIRQRYLDKFPWERIHFWWGDERMVPPNDDESNFKWAFELLIRHTNFPMRNLHRILGEMPEVNENVRLTAELITRMPVEHSAPIFDLIMLGIGEDGHTASIFPDRMDLFETPDLNELVVHPQTGQKRITLTGIVLNNAKNVAFVVTGANKAEVVGSIINKEQCAEAYPASHIKPKYGELTWWLDSEAASAI